MDTQDKEMDGLFRSKLEGLEIEPSATVWTGIVTELNTPKRKVSRLPFLSVAASIIVLIGAGILFIPREEIVPGKPQRETVIAKPATAVNRPALINSKPRQAPVPVKVNSIQSVARVQVKKVTGTNAVTLDIATKPVINAKPEQQQVLAAGPQKQLPPKAVVPDNSTPLTNKQAPEQVQAYSAQPQIAALPVVAINKDTVTARTRHGVHSFGDLVNVLVAKVDKRRDKVIEFSPDDDGESHVTGINLGIIKIKKRE